MAFLKVLYFSILTFYTVCCQKNILFDGNAAIIVSDIDRFNTTAFNISLADFIVDYYNAFGLAPAVMSPKTYSSCSVGKNRLTNIYLGRFDNNPYPISLLPDGIKSCYSGMESHCIILVYDELLSIWSLIAMSNDIRGSIYAMYSISEILFKVDPLYRFSEINGIYFGSKGLELSTNLSYIFPTPLFKYRIAWNNGEDLLGTWGKDPLGMAVHSATVYNWLFESILRMKANAIIAGTDPLPDEISLISAAKRGLIIADHHFNQFGYSSFRFPQELVHSHKWDWTRYPQIMKWIETNSQKTLQAIPNVTVINSVGYRWTNDGAGPCPNCTKQQKGMIESQVISNQTQWLKEMNITGEKIYFFWDEGLTYYADGYLTIPDDVDILLADDGNGNILGLDNYSNISSGIYTHCSYFNYHANQLSEMVSPQKHFDQIGKFSKKSKRNKHAVINISNLKPFLLCTNAAFCYLYHGENCANSADEYIKKWVIDRYLYESIAVNPNQTLLIANDIKNIYNRYYNISYFVNGWNDEMIIKHIVLNAGLFYNDLVENNGIIQNSTIQRMQEAVNNTATNSSLLYLENLWLDTMKLYQRILQDDQILFSQESNYLFQSHIILQESYQYFGNLVISNIFYAALNYQHKNVGIALNLINQSVVYMNEIFKYTHNVEHGVWRGFYSNAEYADFQATRSRLFALYEKLKNGLDCCTIPILNVTLRGYTFYQGPYQINYPLMHYNQSVNIYTFIQIYCINTGNQINNMNVTNCCINNENGGYFYFNNKCKSGAMITFDVIHWNQCKSILYTTNGTIPNQNSLQILERHNTLNFTKTVFLKARCQHQDGSLDDQISTAIYQEI